MIPALIEAALRALLVALTVWAGLRVFRVNNVFAQKIAWGLVLACAAAMPLLMRWLVLPPSMTFRVSAAAWRSTSELPPVPAGGGPPAPHAGLTITSHARLYRTLGPEPGAGDRLIAPTVPAGKLATHYPAQPANIQLQPAPDPEASVALQARFHLPQPAAMAWLVYLAVCVLLLIRMIYGLAMAARLWRSAEPFVPELHPSFCTDPTLGLRLRFSPAVSSPVTIGSGVLLPENCLAWDAEKLRIVLAHERAHVRHRDFYLQLGAGLYAAIFWFSPLGWLLKRKLSELGEAISDRAGLEVAASHASYAQVLLEFAALPRPTLIGVAMARNSNLSQRIDRFLDESRFRRAFALSRRRMVLAVLMVPVALFAATAMVRVEAAASAQAAPAPPAPAAAPNPAQAPNPDAAPSPAPAPAAAPSAPAMGADLAPPAPEAPAPLAAPSADAAPAAQAAPAPARAFISVNQGTMTVSAVQDDAVTSTNSSSDGKHLSTSVGHGYAYSNSSNGDTWVLVTDSSQKITFSGDLHDSTRADIDKVRKLTSGKFLWFTRNGKSYFVDDPALVSQIQAMYKPMEELGHQQEALGKKQEELGRQQEEMGKKQEQASVPTPDISKEMAELNESVARLDAKKGSTVSREELADIEGKLGEIQGRLGELQGKMGARQGEFGEQQGRLGEQQGKLGEEQGRLGEQQGMLAAEADRKVKSIIDQSMRNGKARPVE